jgi:hypothetical protein
MSEGRLSVWRPDDLCAPEPVRWIAADGERGLARGSVSMLASNHAAPGKGFLLMSLGLHVAAGKRWMDRFDVGNGGRVLYLTQFDTEWKYRLHATAHAMLNAGWSQEDVRRAVQRFCVVKPTTNTRHLWDGEATCLGREMLEVAAEYDLIMIDPLQGSMFINELDPHACADAMFFLRKIASAGLAVVVTHYFKKDSDSVIRGCDELLRMCRWGVALRELTPSASAHSRLVLEQIWPRWNAIEPIHMRRTEHGAIVRAPAVVETAAKPKRRRARRR